MLSSLFTSLGWSRDDAKWIWGQVVSAAAAIASGVFDLSYWASYIGIHLSVTQVHIITVVAVFILWLSGKMATSNLFAAGNVPKDGSIIDKFAKSVPIVLIACMLGGAIACYHEPPKVAADPVAHRAWKADEVVQRLKELSDVVKADTGREPGNISYADAFTIIEWVSGDDKHRDANGNLAPTIGVVQMIQTATDQGWKATALQAWRTRIKPLLDKYPQLAPYADLADSILNEVP
jgi:hypothetical protein